MKSKNMLFIAVSLCCALITGAHADLKYTKTMTFGDNSDATPMMRTAHFVADGKERDDTEMTMGNYISKEGIITLCDPRQFIHIDDSLKIYALTDTRSGAAATAVPSTMRGNNAPSREKDGTGKVTVNVKVTELAPEKVSNWDTKHYMVEMHTVTSGCVGENTSDIKMELWVSNVKDVHGCKNDANDVDYAAILGRNDNDGGKCKITYETTGDFAYLSEIWSGLLMRQKMYDAEGKVAMVQEITSLSQAKLDDSVFAIPEGYTKLSIEEYNKRRQQAMMQAMMSGFGNNADDGAKDSDDNSGAQDKKENKKEKKDKKPRFRLPGLPF